MATKSELTPTSETPRSEKFLGDLFNKTQEWLLTKKSGRVKAEFKEEEGKTWNFFDGRRKVHVAKGTFIDTAKGRFALVLGTMRQRVSDSDKFFTFRFGCYPKDSYDESDLTLNKLLDFTDQRPFSYGSGQFFGASSYIRVDCWNDNSVYGGHELNSTLTQNQLLSKKGLEECSDLIRRIARDGFLQFGKSL